MLVPRSLSNMSSHNHFDLRMVCHFLCGHLLFDPNNDCNVYRDDLEDDLDITLKDLGVPTITIEIHISTQVIR